MDHQMQEILDTKGFPYVIGQLEKWATNKHEHIRAYSPEDKEDLKMFEKIQVLLNELGVVYK